MAPAHESETIVFNFRKEFNPTEEKKLEIKIKQDKVQLRFQQNS
jgi:hypothetical protein